MAYRLEMWQRTLACLFPPSTGGFRPLPPLNGFYIPFSTAAPSWDRVQNILDSGLYVDAGHTKPGLWQRKFLVFYSPEHDQCFVVVRSSTGKINTVLPRSFNKTFSWITDAVFEKAKRVYARSVQAEEKERLHAAKECVKTEKLINSDALMSKNIDPRKKKKKKGVSKEEATNVNKFFTINIRFTDMQGRQKTKRLLCIPSEEYEHSIPNLLKDATFPYRVQAACDGLKSAADSVVNGLIISSNETVMYIPLP